MLEQSASAGMVTVGALVCRRWRAKQLWMDSPTVVGRDSVFSSDSKGEAWRENLQYPSCRRRLERRTKPRSVGRPTNLCL